MHPSAPVTSQRSAKRRVLIDRHLLGVELERGPALLVRSPAGALDAAERDVDVCAHGLRVHAQDAGLELVRETVYCAEIAGEDRRGQAERNRVRARDRLVERGEAIERGHRTEHLFAGELRVVGKALDDGRRDEIALVVGAPAAREYRAA